MWMCLSDGQMGQVTVGNRARHRGFSPGQRHRARHAEEFRHACPAAEKGAFIACPGCHPARPVSHAFAWWRSCTVEIFLAEQPPHDQHPQGRGNAGWQPTADPPPSTRGEAGQKRQRPKAPAAPGVWVSGVEGASPPNSRQPEPQQQQDDEPEQSSVQPKEQRRESPSLPAQPAAEVVPMVVGPLGRDLCRCHTGGAKGATPGRRKERSYACG